MLQQDCTRHWKCYRWDRRRYLSDRDVTVGLHETFTSWRCYIWSRREIFI